MTWGYRMMAETVIFMCLVFAAFTSGLTIGLRSGEQKSKSAPQLNTCSCGHGYGTHVGEKRCAGEIKRAWQWSRDGNEINWEYVKCPCLRYDGPEPLSSVMTWAPPSIPQTSHDHHND